MGRPDAGDPQGQALQRGQARRRSEHGHSIVRLACHTGGVITLDQMLAHEQEFASGLDKLTMESPAPLLGGPNDK
jgi:hypothetical protein